MKRRLYFKHKCPVCGANPFWWNTWERTKHVTACEQIEEGLKRGKPDA